MWFQDIPCNENIINFVDTWKTKHKDDHFYKQTFSSTLIINTVTIQESFDSKEERIFGEKYQHYTDIIIGDYKRVWNTIESNREFFMDLRETNDSLFSAKMNNIMKNLTIMSFLTFPLSLMTGIFGVNTNQTPLAGLENGFWIILAIMGVTTLSIIIFLVSKKWI